MKKKIQKSKIVKKTNKTTAKPHNLRQKKHWENT